MANLEKEPRVVLVPYANSPVILTTSDVKLFAFQALYSPLMLFPLLADFLNAIEKDEGVETYVLPPLAAAICNAPPVPILPDDAQYTIDCSDKRYKVGSHHMNCKNFSTNCYCVAQRYSTRTTKPVRQDVRVIAICGCGMRQYHGIFKVPLLTIFP